jgi:hypothetical protein
MISGSDMIPSSSAGADQEPQSTELDMDADHTVELREILASVEEEGSAPPYSDEPISFMDLLLGNWDGFDMQNAIFSDLTQISATARTVENTAQTVRPAAVFEVSSVVEQLRSQHSFQEPHFPQCGI